jgi:RHS repeat-associated protein
LTSASNSVWNETFSYDGFGNLTGKTLNGTLQSIPVSGLTNQLASATYDSNGNMTSGSGATIAYNEDNRMSSAVETSGGAEYYYYTPDGKRFWRQMANGDTQYTLYGAYGEQLGTWGFYPQDRAVSVNFGGRRIWQGASYNSANGSAGAIFPDRTGSNRYNDAANSTMSFYPYGDEITSSAPDQLKFATYTRDSYTGFDYADQRFYASSYGRFNTPDPSNTSNALTLPGNWNLYAYVGGDPVNKNDPRGLCSPQDDPPCYSVTGYGSPFEGSPGVTDSGGIQSPWNDPTGQKIPIQTFAGPLNITVTGYSRTGAKENQIANALSVIQNQVLTGDCASWLTGQDFSASAFISAIMGGGPGSYSFGYGALNSNTTAAFVGNANANGTPVAGLPPDSTITVNSNGAFFSSGYTVGAPGSTQYTGGTLQAQLFILVHELAHEVGAAGFLPDAGNQANVNSNNALVQQHCGAQIAGVH